MLGEFSPLADACKAKGLNGEKRYYYVFFIATKEEERGKGLCPAMMKQVSSSSHSCSSLYFGYI
jgi:hypothetical protein